MLQAVSATAAAKQNSGHSLNLACAYVGGEKKASRIPKDGDNRERRHQRAWRNEWSGTPQERERRRVQSSGEQHKSCRRLDGIEVVDVQLGLVIGGGKPLRSRHVKETLSPRQLLADCADGRDGKKPVCEPDEAAPALRDAGADDRRGSVCAHLSPFEHRVFVHHRGEPAALSDCKSGEKYAAEQGRRSRNVRGATVHGPFGSTLAVRRDMSSG